MARRPGTDKPSIAGKFVGAPIRPVASTLDTSRMAAGEPGLPRCFVWRDRTCEIATVIRTWREAAPCRHGSGERYVRRHWYEVQLTDGAVATLYFERQARPGGGAKRQWRLFSRREPEVPPPRSECPGLR